MVEFQPSKLDVTGSNPVARSILELVVKTFQVPDETATKDVNRDSGIRPRKHEHATAGAQRLRCQRDLSQRSVSALEPNEYVGFCPALRLTRGE